MHDTNMRKRRKFQNYIIVDLQHGGRIRYMSSTFPTKNEFNYRIYCG